MTGPGVRGDNGEEQSGKVLLLGSEGCGTGDRDLGFEVLVALLDTLPERDDRPCAIIFWNTAAGLLAEDSPLVGRLKRLQEQGVDIVAGQACASDLGLVGKIAVGRLADMGEILDLILQKQVITL